MKLLLLLSLLFLGLHANGQTISTIAGNGSAGYGGDGHMATLAQLNLPEHIAFDPQGNMYISDALNQRIRKIDTTGEITTIAGTGICGFNGNYIPATTAQLYAPTGVIVDNSGNIFISTGNDHRIRKVDTAGIITTIAGTGTIGYNGDHISAMSAELATPYVGAVDASGNIYFSDFDNHRVRKISASGIITTVAGNGIVGSSGDGGPATNANLRGPGWVTISPSGELYIPDKSCGVVRKVSAAGIITTIAGGGTGGDGVAATNAALNFPSSVALDSVGNIYVGEYGAHRIRKIDSVGIITTVAGTAVAGYNGDSIPATAAQLNYPSGLAINRSGDLFIADYHNNRIRKIPPDTSHIRLQVSAEEQVITVVFPNPTATELIVTTNARYHALTILNNLGQAMLQQAITHSSTTVDVKVLPPGIYFVKLKGDGQTRVMQFLKE